MELSTCRATEGRIRRFTLCVMAWHLNYAMIGLAYIGFASFVRVGTVILAGSRRKWQLPPLSREKRRTANSSGQRELTPRITPRKGGRRKRCQLNMLGNSPQFPAIRKTRNRPVVIGRNRNSPHFPRVGASCHKILRSEQDGILPVAVAQLQRDGLKAEGRWPHALLLKDAYSCATMIFAASSRSATS